MNEPRLEDIEIKLTRQEDLLETLNMQVYQQQKKIDELEMLCAALVKRFKEATGNQNQTGLPHEKPPHY
ncbi:SlyX protein [Oxalobacteraceae bacterium GrIS 2.11]